MEINYLLFLKQQRMRRVVGGTEIINLAQRGSHEPPPFKKTWFGKHWYTYLLPEPERVCESAVIKAVAFATCARLMWSILNFPGRQGRLSGIKSESA